MKIMKESLLGVSAVSAFAIPCAMVFAASEFDWHLGLMRENPVLFFKVVLKISGVIIGGLLLGGLLQNSATRNSWVKRRFKWLFFAVYCVGLCLIMVCFSPFPSRIDIMTHVEMMKAERGDVDAQYSLAQCYSYGRGVETNEVEAVKWLRKAAEQGHVDAQYSLAQCYSYGKGVETNEEEAVKWLCKAAEQGHADAQYSLAQCYSYGKGVETNEEEAVKWLRKAAEQGEKFAQLKLGMRYCLGRGITQSIEDATKWFDMIQENDPRSQYCFGLMFLEKSEITQELAKEAVKWFRKAAEQGDADAQFVLGVCYLEGVGITQDKTEAMKWLQKAAKQGHEKAKKGLTEINKQERSELE